MRSCVVEHRRVRRSTEEHRGAQRSTEEHRGVQRSIEEHSGSRRSTKEHRGPQRTTEVLRGASELSRLRGIKESSTVTDVVAVVWVNGSGGDGGVKVPVTKKAC